MRTAVGGRRPELAGDEAELFREFTSRLVRTVQRRTASPREIVDDARASAWQEFLRSQPDRGRNWRAWSIMTASGRRGGCTGPKRVMRP